MISISLYLNHCRQRQLKPWCMLRSMQVFELCHCTGTWRNDTNCCPTWIRLYFVLFFRKRYLLECTWVSWWSFMGDACGKSLSAVSKHCTRNSRPQVLLCVFQMVKSCVVIFCTVMNYVGDWLAVSRYSNANNVL